jgi:plasmid stability protein
MNEPKTMISLQLPTSTKAELEERAEAAYRSVSAEVRAAIDAHLLRHEQPPEKASS